MRTEEEVRAFTNLQELPQIEAWMTAHDVAGAGLTTPTIQSAVTPISLMVSQRQGR